MSSLGTGYSIRSFMGLIPYLTRPPKSIIDTPKTSPRETTPHKMRKRRAEHLVLVADDSEDDGLLLQMAFERLDRSRLVGRAHNGEELIAYLEGVGKYADR